MGDAGEEEPGEAGVVEVRWSSTDVAQGVVGSPGAGDDPGVPMRIVARPTTSLDLLVPSCAVAQDGAFTRSQARAQGFSDGRARRLIRMGLWVPVAGSVLRHRDQRDGPWLRARAVSLSHDRVVSHATAAALWGLDVPPELHAIADRGRPVRGIRDHRIWMAESEVVTVAGLRVTSAHRTLADLIRVADHIGTIACVTDGLRRGVLDPADLFAAAAAAAGRWGAARAREVASSCRSRPFSVLEWRFHDRARRVDLDWQFNVPISDELGLIGVVDALHVPSGTIIELDGRAFHGSQNFQSDRSRDQRLAAAGYLVIRFTWEDLDLRMDHVEEVIRRTISLRMNGPRNGTLSSQALHVAPPQRGRDAAHVEQGHVA